MKTKRISEIKGMEEIRDIYIINENGEVYSEAIKRNMKIGDNGKGYKTIALKIKDKKQNKKAYIHRLVALSFLDNPNSCLQVNHINEIKSDNRLLNLEWTTSKQNNNHGTKIERHKDTISRDIYILDYKLEKMWKFRSLLEAQREIGIPQVKKINTRTGDYFVFDFIPKIEDIISVAQKCRFKTIVLENIQTNETIYFSKNRDARRFFNNNINISDSIKKNHTIKGKYKAYELQYNLLRYSPNLQKKQLQEVRDKEPLR